MKKLFKEILMVVLTVTFITTSAVAGNYIVTDSNEVIPVSVIHDGPTDSYKSFTD